MRLQGATPLKLIVIVALPHASPLVIEGDHTANSLTGKLATKPVVLLSGEAGIGKSRLVQMLKDHVADERHVRWECRSLPYFENTALFPLTDLFQRLLQFQAEDTPDEKVGKLEQMLSQYRLPVEESVQLFAPLLTLPVPENRYPLL